MKDMMVNKAHDDDDDTLWPPYQSKDIFHLDGHHCRDNIRCIYIRIDDDNKDDTYAHDNGNYDDDDGNNDSDYDMLVIMHDS